MDLRKKHKIFFLPFLVYFLLIALLPFDHCHAMIDMTGENHCHGPCKATDADVVQGHSISPIYEHECHAHQHHLRFIIDSEDAGLKSSPAGTYLPAFTPCDAGMDTVLSSYGAFFFTMNVTRDVSSASSKECILIHSDLSPPVL